MPKINIKIFLPLVLLIIVIVFALFFILQFKSVEEEAGPVEKTLTKEGMEKFYQGLSETATGTKQYINSYTLVENLGEGNFKAEISNLPRITPDGKEINIAWTQKGEGIFESGNNLFAVSVEGAQVTASALFDLSGDIKKGDSAVWNPQVFLNGKEVKSISETPTLLNTDPMNKNYANNVLEWDYGICKRQLRLIEGGVQEFYVFDKDPEGDIKIKSNNEGELKASAYFALDGDKRPIFQGFTFNDKGEKFLTKEAFGLAKYPILVDDSFSGLSSNSDCELVAGSYDYLSARNSTDAKIGYNNGFTTWAVDVGQYQTWNNQYRVMRGFVYFDTSFIPDNATISSAKLKLYGISYYSSTRYIRVLSGQPTYPHDPIQMSDFNQTLYPLTYGGSINANVWTAYGAYQDIGLNSTGIDWIQKGSGAQTKFCLRNSDDIAGNYVERDTFIYSAESGNGPIFEVTYALPSVPQISVTPSSQSFGNVGVGSVKDLTFTVQNTGGGTLSGSISGLTAPFSCVSGCSYSLGASASQTATIRFSPTAVGNFSDTAVFSGAAGASRSVSGSGVIPKCIPTGTTNVNYTISQASLGGGSLCEISGDEGVEGGDITIGSGVTVQVNANSSLVFNPGKRIFVNGIIAKSANNTKVVKGHLGGSCTPSTCTSLGKSCGSWADGCGGTLNCGSCSGSTACDYGSCTATQRPSWYCNNGTCAYSCSYDASCVTSVCEKCVSALPSEANYFADIGENLIFFVKNPQSGITYSFGGSGDCSCSNCAQCSRTAGSQVNGSTINYTGIAYANGSYLGSAMAYVCDYGSSYTSSNPYNLTPSIGLSETKEHMCSRSSNGIYYKVTIPSGYKCNLSWTINYGANSGGFYRLYTRLGGIPSTSSYDCLKSVQRSTTLSGTCSYNQLSAGSYYAYIGYTWSALGQIENNTRPQADYRLTATLSNCTGGSSASWYPNDPGQSSCTLGGDGSCTDTYCNSCNSGSGAGQYISGSGTISCPSGKTAVTGKCVAKNDEDCTESRKTSDGKGWYCSFTNCHGWFCRSDGCGWVKCQ